MFINYGFVTRALHRLMHPRVGEPSLGRLQRKRADAILRFVGARGAVHPRDVDAEFAHGTVTNYWGGSSNATTHLLDLLHYAGRVRVLRRDAGVRVYALQESIAPPPDRAVRVSRLDAIVDVAVGKYAPLPAASLAAIVARLRYAVPQWRPDLRAALQRATRRLAHTTVDSVDWYWPADETPGTAPAPEGVRLLAPFDPVVWDRRRFELLWGWPYRFEAYTPVKRRKFGYYALPMLWRDRVIGWTNVSSINAALHAESGYVDGQRPRGRTFNTELDLELDRLREFLKSPSMTVSTEMLRPARPW